MDSFEELILRYRAELKALVARRRRLDALIAAKRDVLRDLEATAERQPRRAPPRGRITQVEAVRRVLADSGEGRTAAEIYAAALEAGAGGSERSLRNVLSRLTKSGELGVDRRTFPQRYFGKGSDAPAG
jgi:hypothetical protein